MDGIIELFDIEDEMKIIGSPLVNFAIFHTKGGAGRCKKDCRDLTSPGGIRKCVVHCSTIAYNDFRTQSL